MKGNINFNVVQEIAPDGMLSIFSRLIDESGVPDRKEALDRIERRERLGATAIGDGIAVPHAKIPGIEVPSIVIGILSSPVSYGGKDVRIILMLLLPVDVASSSVELMSKLVSAVSTEEGRARVISAGSPEEVEEVFLG